MNKAAQSLGRLAKGVPKNYNAEEIERRSKILAGVNARRSKRAEMSRIRRNGISVAKRATEEEPVK